MTSLVAGGQELKSRSQFRTPLEPIISKLANGYVDGSDLSLQLRRLFSVRPHRRRRPRRRGRGSPGDADGRGRAAARADDRGISGGRNAGPVTVANRRSEPARLPHGQRRITGFSKRRVAPLTAGASGRTQPRKSAGPRGQRSRWGPARMPSRATPLTASPPPRLPARSRQQQVASVRARVRGQVLDSGGSGGLDAREFCAAIRKLVRRPGARAQRSCCGRLSLVIAVALFFAMGSGGERRKMRGKRAHSCTH